MANQYEINRKILTEIDNIEVSTKMKAFLGEILSCELDNLDREKWAVTEKYKEIMDSIFGAENNDL